MRISISLGLALLAVSAGAAHAAEPDNSYDTATPMAGATDYEGDLASMGDEDWLTFTAGITGKARITLTMTANTCSSTAMFVRVMDGGFDQVEVLYGGPTPTTVDLDVVTNARYYLQAGGGCTGTTYRLRVDPAGAVKSSPSAPAPGSEAEQAAPTTSPSTPAKAPSKKRLKKPPLGLYNCLHQSQGYTGFPEPPQRWVLKAGGKLRDITFGEAKAMGGRWTVKSRIVRIFSEKGSLLGKFSAWRDASGPYLIETAGSDKLVCRRAKG